MPNVNFSPLGSQAPFIACSVIMEKAPVHIFSLPVHTAFSSLGTGRSGDTSEGGGSSSCCWYAASCSCHSAASITFGDIHQCLPPASLGCTSTDNFPLIFSGSSVGRSPLSPPGSPVASFPAWPAHSRFPACHSWLWVPTHLSQPTCS